MAFRKKAHLILGEKPDILIVPECEHPDKLLRVELNAKTVLWHGKNKSKGLAVFSFGDYQLSLMPIHNEDIHIVCPIEVTGGEIDFILLAAWAQPNIDYDYRYIGQIWKAVHYYQDILKADKVIIVGDFNSNVIWDKNHHVVSHSMTVKKLLDMHIQSAYHVHLAQIQGQEIHPTFHMYRHENKPYHIDYCFISPYFLKRLTTVEVGDYQYWKTCSDHSPLTVEFNI